MKLAAQSILALLFCLPLYGQSVQPTPFGFRMGMTRAQIVAQVGTSAVVKEDEGMMVLSTAPMPHPAFEKYGVFISPDKGLLKVVAIGVTVSSNEEGEQLKEAFHAVLTPLQAKYGQPQLYDLVNGGDVNKEPQFWMMTLLNKERTLQGFWNADASGTTKTGISIEATALDIQSGYILVTYEFPGWNDYLDAKKLKKDAAF